MRWLWMAVPLLGSCAGAGILEEPDDPAALAEMLGSGDPLRREEAAHRLSLLGVTVHEALGPRAQVAALLDEDTASMRVELARALGERDAPRIVWRAYHILRGGCLGRDWGRVSDALSRQGFRLSEIYEPQGAEGPVKFVRFPAGAAVYVNPGGDRHDLFFWVQTARRDAGWIVREVYIGLNVAFDAAFKQVAAGGRYPRGSLLARFLELPEVAKLAMVYPVLEEIELTYGRIRDREAGTVAAGFHVNAGFAMAGEGKGGGRGIYCTAESGLDPPSTRRGRLLRDGFVPSDSLGPLTLRGSSFWGAGGLKPSGD